MRTEAAAEAEGNPPEEQEAEAAEAGSRYDTNSYRRAIEYGMKRAKKAGFVVPHWHPHQLRHNRGTEVRRKYGIEAAQVALGHAKGRRDADLRREESGAGPADREGDGVGHFCRGYSARHE